MSDAHLQRHNLGHRRRSWAALACAAGIGAAIALLLSSADALFLSRVGSRHLGTAFALSSAVSMVVLWWVGTLADTRDRGRLLRIASAVGIALVGVILISNESFPKLSAAALLIVGKQAGGAMELLLWVVIADRFTAREARKLLPWVVVANGMGMALGALSVGPLASSLGAMGPLWAALFLLLIVSGFATLLTHAPDSRFALGVSRNRARADKPGISLLWQRPLAKWLAILVASAGVFAPVMYYLLGVSAAAEFSSEVELAGFFGQFRAYVQVAALVAQVTIAPWLSQRLGIGVLLILAPFGAAIVSIVVGFRGEFIWICLAQAMTRILDTAIQNPAEQLIQNLLPPDIRGRVAGLVGGVAKRSGAILGGLAASLFIVRPSLFSAVLIGAALLWLAIAIHLWRHFSEYAVTELATSHRPMDSHTLALRFASERDLQNLRKSLRSTDRREQRNALSLLGRIGEHGKIDAVEELLDALTRCIKLAPELRLALRLRIGVGEPVSTKASCAALLLLKSQQSDERDLAVEILGFGELSESDKEWVLSCARASDSLAGQLYAVREDKQSVLEELVGTRDSVVVVHQLRYEIVNADHGLSADSSEDLAERLLRSLSHCPIPELQVAGLHSVLRAMENAGPSALGILLDQRLADLSLRWRQDSLPELREASLVAMKGQETTDYQVWISALSDSEESVRNRAEFLLRGAGESALAALSNASQSGRRRVRMRAVEILADLRPSAETLDALLERELAEMVRCSQSVATLQQLPNAVLVRKRLTERIDESLQAALMALEVRLANTGIGEVAKRLARAGGERSRSRALEALDALLPRKMSRTILGAVEGKLPIQANLEECVQWQLKGRDTLTRDLLLYALDERDRAGLRQTIANLAELAAEQGDSESLIRRLVNADRDTLGLEVPTTLETIVALSDLALFSDMTTLQLEELATVVEWVALQSGDLLMAQGEEATCMYFVQAGELEVTVDEVRVATVGKGEPVGEMGLFAQEQRSATVLALEESLLGRIRSEALENLVEEVPGVALRLCKAMSRRLVRATRS